MRALVAWAAVLAGCALGNPALEDEPLDDAAFRCRVESILARRCAFPACHGDPARPFRVYAPNRLRYGLPADALPSPLTPEEHDANLRAATSFAGPSAGYAEPLLVAKPLSERLGGAYHGGAEQFGAGDVFEAPDDPDLAALRVWVAGAAEEPSCAR